MWCVVYSDELHHHGIKGQKWGVRRFQNPDGTLTATGRKRYNEYSDGTFSEKSVRTKNLEIKLAKSKRKDKYEKSRKEKRIEKATDIAIAAAPAALALGAGYVFYRHEINDCIRAIRNVSVSQLSH